jgi:pimeloyl-ACP methyl ester carboxylesterase
VTDAKLLRGFEERSGRIKGTRLRYYLGGEGPPLVLVHGLGGAASNWTALAPLLAARRRVLIPELPGHGGSAPLAAAPSLVPYADRVLRVADAEGMLPAPLVGHSLGGVVVLRAAMQEPDAVAALVLAGAAGIGSSTPRAARMLAVVGAVRPARWIAPYRARIVRSDRLRAAAFGFWFTADPQALLPETALGFLGAPLLHTDIGSAWRALVHDDPRADLESVRCPCLVLWGARDRQLPVSDAFDYARRLRARLRVIADCGHLLIGERPDACADAILSFLG